MVYKILVIFVFAAIFFIVILKIQIDIYTKHKESTNGVINHDCLMRTFCYKVKMSKQGIADALLVKSIYDEAEFSYEPDSQIR